jgi:hypothetical protein
MMFAAVTLNSGAVDGTPLTAVALLFAYCLINTNQVCILFVLVGWLLSRRANQAV